MPSKAIEYYIIDNEICQPKPGYGDSVCAAVGLAPLVKVLFHAFFCFNNKVPKHTVIKVHYFSNPFLGFI